jgi:hypothetical protein
MQGIPLPWSIGIMNLAGSAELNPRAQRVRGKILSRQEFPPEELGDAGRVRWVSGTPGKPPAYAGADFIVARNGRIASVYLFFDSLH